MKRALPACAFLSLLLAAGVRADASLPSAAPAPEAAPEDGPPLPMANPARVITTFHEAYVRHQQPRILIYVNRPLVADRGELIDAVQVTRSTQVKGDPVPLPSVSVQVGEANQTGAAAPASGQGGERRETTTAAVRTDTTRPLGAEPITEVEAREVEEAFQRPFFEARTRLVDQGVAELARRVFASPPPALLTGAAPTKEQQELESLKRSTEIVVEVLVRRRAVSLPQPSGVDQTQTQFDVVATAVNLKDGLKLAQVSSDTLFGFNARDGERRRGLYRRVTAAEMTEQTALALMERLARLQ